MKLRKILLISLILSILSISHMHAVQLTWEYSTSLQDDSLLDYFEMSKYYNYDEQSDNVDKWIEKFNNEFKFDHPVDIKIIYTNNKVYYKEYENKYDYMIYGIADNDSTDIYIIGIGSWVNSYTKFKETVLHEIGHQIHYYFDRQDSITFKTWQEYCELRGLDFDEVFFKRDDYAMNVLEMFARDFAWVLGDDDTKSLFPNEYLNDKYKHPNEINGLEEFILSLQIKQSEE